MIRRILALLAFLLALCGWTSCGPVNPPPVPPGLGGAPGSGGATATGGTPAGGAPGATGGASAGATGQGTGGSVVVRFPECNETMRAPMRVRPSLSGWHKDPSRAKWARPRASYSIVSSSVFRAPNFVTALDQGSLGSCTGNAVAHCLSTHPFGAMLAESDAVRIYGRATEIDPWKGTYPPTDTGSNGESAWRAAIDLGYYSGTSSPVFSLEELQNALQKVPCALGTDWYSGFYTPARCGEMSLSGTVEGGHEIAIVGWEAELKRVWIRNSWGPDWGVRRGEETGYAYFSAGTLQKLLNQGAEIDCPSWP